jgi:iron complex transport system substrate-binding protein
VINKRTGILIPITFLLLGFFLSDLSFSLTPEDRLTEKKYPERIISLGPYITEELFLLGEEDRLVGCTTYCSRPRDAEKKEKVASAVMPNVEKIVSLRPDLILATTLIDKKAVVKLKHLGLRVETFPVARNFDHLCEIFLKLGKMVGKEDVAVEIIKKSKKRVRLIKEKVDGLNRTRVFVQIGAKPLFTVIGDTFINDLILCAGGLNIAQDAKTGLYSREAVLNRNPEVIVISTMGMVGLREKENWKRYKTIDAVKNNRIYVVDADKLCSPTPLSFVEMLEKLAQIFHPSEIKQ